MKLVRLCAAGVALLTLAAGFTPVYGDIPAVPSLSVVESPTGLIFNSGDEVRLRVTVENTGQVRWESTVTLAADSRTGDWTGQAEAPLSLEPGENGEAVLLLKSVPYGGYRAKITAGQTTVEATFSVSPPSAATADVSRFGVCTHVIQGKGHIPQLMEVAAHAGAGWLRDECYWSMVEQERGVYRIPGSIDEAVDAARARDMRHLLILNYENALYDDGAAPHSEEGIRGFAAYCAAVAAHFKGRVSHYEIWNEYNHRDNTKDNPPSLYADMLKAAYTAIKEADPDAFVVGCSTAYADLDWIYEVLEAGGYDYMDAVSIHPYSVKEDPQTAGLAGQIEEAHELIRRYGPDKPVWITELGWTTAYGFVDEREAAANLVKSFVLASLYPDDRIFWYDLQNDGTDAREGEHNFGLVRCWQEETVTYAAKLPYLAFTAASHQLRDAGFVADRSDGSTFAYEFGGADRQVYVIWSAEGEIPCRLPAEYDRAVSVDIYGNESPLAITGGQIEATARALPQYIVADRAGKSAAARYLPLYIAGGAALLIGGIAAFLLRRGRRKNTQSKTEG